MRLDAPKRKSGAGGVVLGFLILVAAAGATAYSSLRVGDPPSIALSSSKAAVGRRTAVFVALTEPVRGLERVEVHLVQDKLTEVLAEKSWVPQPSWAPWAPKTAEARLELEVGKELQPGLREGELRVEVRAFPAGTWLLAPAPAEASLVLPVKLTPPTLAVLSKNTYVVQGGSEAVVYEVGPTATRHGVRAGKWIFPGAALPGAPGRSFALFSAPYDLGSDAEIRLFAEDEVGNRAERAFLDLFTPKPYAKDQIAVTDKFMQAVVPRIMEQTPDFRDRGALLANYVAINNELRGQNDAKLAALAEGTRPELLWNQPFLQMNAQVFASFADRRSYLYEGKLVDEQFHLGFDLASTKQAEVPAANGGYVVLAEYLGIYGNTVVIDHGFGLMSLYGHLSWMGVKPGDKVERGQMIAKTGATGLALGDHLHFTILLHGLPVRPLEWWDGAWIENRIAAKLGDALGFVK